jgi:hypothetical protein
MRKRIEGSIVKRGRKVEKRKQVEIFMFIKTEFRSQEPEYPIF